MKTSKIGDLNYKDFKTEIHATPKIKQVLDKEDLSTANLIPNAWAWYGAELLDVIDENHDGKPDKSFGKNFKIIYYAVLKSRDYSHGAYSEKTSEEDEEIKKLEREALIIGSTNIKNIYLKYLAMKNASDK